MANFKIAYDITMGHEGGYTNDTTDRGGETYKGISRVYNPNWSGWKIIDELKTKPNFKTILKNNKQLDILVESLYKEKYWDVLNLDKITSQRIANEMFDTCVNMSDKRAGKFLQESLNFLNRNQKNYNDIEVDGIVGKNTLNILNIVLQLGDELILLKIMNILQGMHYIEYMRKYPDQEKYARGWLNRVTISKE